MFNNLTTTYSGADATWEILIMLTGAFLLGFLLCCLIRKLRGMDNPPGGGKIGHDGDLEKIIKEYTAPKKTPQQANQSYKARKVGVVDQSTYSTPKIDDLKKVSSIDERIESLLRDKGVKSYIDLRDVEHKTLFEVMDTPNFNVSKQEVETWPHQASLAAKAEWKKLNEYQEFRDRLQNVSKSTPASPAEIDKKQADDLTRIAGISPEIATTLNKHGISSFTHLRESNEDALKSYLLSDGISTAKLNYQSWHQQAVLADAGKWDELDEYQDFLSINDDNLDLGGLSTVAETKSSKESIPTTGQQITSDLETSSVSKLNITDDLKKIEGIGVKIEEVLKNNGIDTFEKLHNSKRSTLKSLLDKAGPQFKMHEPESWPHQAGMAHRGEWEKLKEYHDFMAGGRDNTVSLSSSSRHSDITRINTKQTELKNTGADDFTKIEGIGPKIQEVLNSHDIKTFEQLHNSRRSTLKQYLEQAGPQFMMHEPESWPHQAGMAHKGEWDKLREYQDFMLGEHAQASSADSSSDSSVTKAASLSTSYVDDLTKIEGIGPKIEHLLNEAGILNFAQLASADRDTIKSILEKGGPQFKMHEPKTWPKQAQLADKAEWNELKAYQDELLGGR